MKRVGKWQVSVSVSGETESKLCNQVVPRSEVQTGAQDSQR